MVFKHANNVNLCCSKSFKFGSLAGVAALVTDCGGTGASVDGQLELFN